jgi:hypothetical protein
MEKDNDIIHGGTKLAVFPELDRNFAYHTRYAIQLRIVVYQEDKYCLIP